MKVRKIKVELYDWRVSLIDITSKKDVPRTNRILKKFGVTKEDRLIVLKNIEDGMYDGGEHFYNTRQRKSIIFLYRITSQKSRKNILCHEKRHLEDRILNHCLVDDIESAAYLAGYLGEKLL
jgi:hypothetical protein